MARKRRIIDISFSRTHLGDPHFETRVMEEKLCVRAQLNSPRHCSSSARSFLISGSDTAALDGTTARTYHIPPRVQLYFERSAMNSLFPVPQQCLAHLKQAGETGVGYQIVSVALKDGKCFDQVVVSEGCIIEVRGYDQIPFGVHDIMSVCVNHERWNFRDASDSRRKARAACA